MDKPSDEIKKINKTIGISKARSIRRLCMILDNKGEKYNVEELIEKSREEINDMINQNIDYPYQRFDS